jgi:putative DNA methylase
MTSKKKLIEVALPLEAINEASVREGYIYRGNPSAIHKWWAQRPMAAVRAVIFAQMVDDPSAHPDLFPTAKAQEKERRRLFQIIEDLVLWENTGNETVLQQAKDEIWQSWRYTCAECADHPRAKDLFDRHKLPVFHDPFAGGGTLPLEAQRLGLNSYASDLNPVAVLINKSLIETPPKFANKPPVNPDARGKQSPISHVWRGVQGLAEDLRYYGRWVHEEAEKRIGHLYPKVEVTPELVKERPILHSLLGEKLTVIAWLWARTVKSPNPAFAQVDVPLASTFMLSTKAGKEAYVELVTDGPGYHFTVRSGKPKEAEAAKRGTKSGISGTSFLCAMSGTPMPFDYLRLEAKAGRMGARLMAMVVQGERGRVYLSPTAEMESIALGAQPHDVPETELPKKALGFRVQEYGMTRWRDLFSSRQLVALTTYSDLVRESRERVRRDALAAGLDDGKPLAEGGIGALAYSDAVATLLAFSVDKAAEYGCTIVPWYSKEDRPKGLFARQAIPMVWDYAEVNPFADIGGAFIPSVNIVAGSLAGCPDGGPAATVRQMDATADQSNPACVVSTDPPYYDNIAYADLSDFFYVWLRQSLKPVFPELFSTLTVPKAEELVATPYRHGTKEKAEAFFLEGMTRAMGRLAEQAHPAYPVSLLCVQAGRDRRGGWIGDLDGQHGVGHIPGSCHTCRLCYFRHLADEDRAGDSQPGDWQQCSRLQHCPGLPTARGR